jgi:AcrR family transcriptional regulator
MPKPFSAAERERIRERLLSAGKRSINKVGIRLLSVDELVKEAGISKGSFYSFYPSREDFILSVFESWENEYRGALLKEITEGEDAPRMRMERFFLGAFDILEREPGLARTGFKDIERLMEGLPPERLAAHQAADDKALSEAFARWSRDGLLAPGFDQAFRGLVPALFVLAMHKEDFPPGSYGPATRLIAEALAMRITEPKGEAS